MKTSKFNLSNYLKRGSKYGNIPAKYGARTYHSKKEAEYAIALDDMVKLGEIQSWEPQFKLKLDVNGEHITNYIADFIVTTNTGLLEIHEVKGFWTPVATFKWRLAQALYRNEYKFVAIQ